MTTTSSRAASAAQTEDEVPPDTTGLRPLLVRSLGSVPYPSALELQTTLVAERRTGHVSDQLLLMEHPHVITLGSSARRSRDNILAPPHVLAERQVQVHDVSRGGDVTYHGPGQLIGYPILDLKPDRCDVHRYVRDLEEVLIRTARHLDITATRLAGLTGVWVGDEKLAAIGVRISRWVTSHGFALNVSTDLGYFDLIRPCGIRDRGVTSLQRLLGRLVTRAEITPVLVQAFCDVFEREPRTASAGT